jgi:AraC-like DNA-binding protein
VTDTLSDVLRAVRLTGAVFFSVDASAPWVAEAPSASAIGPRIMPGVDHVIEYHVVTSGSCWGGLVDEPAVHLESGDVLVFPQGDPHVLSSAPGMRGRSDMDVARLAAADRLPIAISIDGGGPDRAHVVCGFLGCDARPFNPLLASLPRVIHLRGSSHEGPVLRPFVELALAESRATRPGGECVLARLSELLFVEVVRRYLATLPPEDVGWLAGLRDDCVGRALQKLHERPARAWTLDDLAKECAVSRSVLAERFSRLVGVPPMQYLAKWRMQLAASLLRSTDAPLAQIAEQVGYGSETALSHAFKRWLGVAPSPYRRRPASFGRSLRDPVVGGRRRT